MSSAAFSFGALRVKGRMEYFNVGYRCKLVTIHSVSSLKVVEISLLASLSFESIIPFKGVRLILSQLC